MHNDNFNIKCILQSDYVLSPNARQLLLSGKCMFLRLKIDETKSDVDVHEYLLSLLFGEPELPSEDKIFTEEWCVNN